MNYCCFVIYSRKTWWMSCFFTTFHSFSSISFSLLHSEKNMQFSPIPNVSYYICNQWSRPCCEMYRYLSKSYRIVCNSNIKPTKVIHDTFQETKMFWHCFAVQDPTQAMTVRWIWGWLYRIVPGISFLYLRNSSIFAFWDFFRILIFLPQWEWPVVW